MVKKLFVQLMESKFESETMVTFQEMMDGLDNIVQATRATVVYPEAPKEYTEHDEILAFGKYKGKSFRYAAKDRCYVKWCVDHCHSHSSGDLIKFVEYCAKLDGVQPSDEGTGLLAHWCKRGLRRGEARQQAQRHQPRPHLRHSRRRLQHDLPWLDLDAGSPQGVVPARTGGPVRQP